MTITDPTMTRFLITLDEALDLVDLAMAAPATGAVYVKRSPAATVAQLARVIAGTHPTVVTGVRPGEKKHEHLVVPDEHAIEDGEHFRILPSLPGTGLRYSSDQAPHLSDEELAGLIEQAPDGM